MRVVFIKPLPTHKYPFNAEFNKEYPLFSIFKAEGILQLSTGEYAFNIDKHHINFEEAKECFKIIEE